MKVEIGYTKPPDVFFDGQLGNTVKCLAQKEYHKLLSLLLCFLKSAACTSAARSINIHMYSIIDLCAIAASGCVLVTYSDNL